jgi:hypothetical protein
MAAVTSPGLCAALSSDGASIRSGAVLPEQVVCEQLDIPRGILQVVPLAVVLPVESPRAFSSGAEAGDLREVVFEIVDGGSVRLPDQEPLALGPRRHRCEPAAGAGRQAAPPRAVPAAGSDRGSPELVRHRLGADRAALRHAAAPGTVTGHPAAPRHRAGLHERGWCRACRARRAGRRAFAPSPLHATRAELLRALGHPYQARLTNERAGVDGEPGRAGRGPAPPRVDVASRL